MQMTIIAAAFSAAFLMAAPVRGQITGQCVTAKEVAHELLTQHSEHLAATGVTSSGWQVEFYTSALGTWTQVIYEPRSGCLRAVLSGDGWRDETSTKGSPV